MDDAAGRTPLDVPVTFEAFRAAVSDTFVPLDAATADGQAFEGRIRSHRLGAVHVAEVAAGAHLIRRTPKLIRSEDPEYFKLGLQVSGVGVLSQDGREAGLAPGDFAIYDTSRPYELAFDDEFHMLVVMFPRQLLRVPAGDMRKLTARTVCGRQGVGALVTPLLRGVGERAASAQPAVAAHLSEAVLDLLTASYAEQLECEAGVPPETRQAALLLRIRAFVEDRLSDPDLSPTVIASAHHISVRYLQKLFESEGTTASAWVRARRLERCRRDLADPGLSGRSVASIAASWGILDAAHFSRLFRSTYGRSPKEYRLSVTSSAQVPNRDL